MGVVIFSQKTHVYILAAENLTKRPHMCIIIKFMDTFALKLEQNG